MEKCDSVSSIHQRHVVYHAVAPDGSDWISLDGDNWTSVKCKPTPGSYAAVMELFRGSGKETTIDGWTRIRVGAMTLSTEMLKGGTWKGHRFVRQALSI